MTSLVIVFIEFLPFVLYLVAVNNCCKLFFENQIRQEHFHFLSKFDVSTVTMEWDLIRSSPLESVSCQR